MPGIVYCCTLINTLAAEVPIGNLLGYARQRAVQYNRDIQYAESRL